MTPVERHGAFLVKRDDLFEVAGVRGGKARTCWQLAQGAPGLVTAGARSSPQVNIVAHIARALGVPCRAHVPSGAIGSEVALARLAGAEIVQHSPGYNTVIVARARADARARGWTEIPFGMECQAAVDSTAAQVANLPFGEFQRIVMPVGSGMSLAGVLRGLVSAGRTSTRVLGVVVGADPSKRLARYAPRGSEAVLTLVAAGLPYSQRVRASVGELSLDPIYEAKCVRFLFPGDLLWVVGVRMSEIRRQATGAEVGTAGRRGR